MEVGAPTLMILAVRERLAKAFNNRVVALQHEIKWRS